MKALTIKPVKMFFLFLCSIFSIGVLKAQEVKKGQENDKVSVTNSLIKAKAFTFKAQSVMPLRGGTRQLTSDYDLKVSGDTLIAYLPYFGRAYAAPVNPNEGGIQFTSTDFEYKMEERKKGGWNIVIKPKDNTNVREMMLSVSKKGYANLQVLSNNRDAISFSGYITDNRKQR